MSRAPKALSGPFVVGVAEDSHSDDAVRAALDLGRSFGARLLFVHGVHEGRVLGGETPEASKAVARSRGLTEAKERLAARLDGLVLDSTDAPPSESLCVLPGKPAKVLLDRAEELGADLIVLGGHRRRGVVDFGSTARTVLAHAGVPVWCQPEPAHPVRRILAPVDLSDDSRAAVDLARGVGRALGAPLTLLHCFAYPDFAYSPRPGLDMPTYVVDQQRELAHQEFKRFVGELFAGEEPPRLLFAEGDAAARVLELQDDHDLLVMATHGRGALSAAVLGSVTYSVLRDAHRPVLAVRHPARRAEL